MSSKRNHKPNVKPCMCSLCGVEAVSTPGTYHRRCSGQAPGETAAPVRPKHNLVPKANRGKWQ